MSQAAPIHPGVVALLPFMTTFPVPSLSVFWQFLQLGVSGYGKIFCDLAYAMPMQSPLPLQSGVKVFFRLVPMSMMRSTEDATLSPGQSPSSHPSPIQPG
jgi:hypothetical protein